MFILVIAFFFFIFFIIKKYCFLFFCFFVFLFFCFLINSLAFWMRVTISGSLYFITASRACGNIEFSSLFSFSTYLRTLSSRGKSFSTAAVAGARRGEGNGWDWTDFAGLGTGCHQEEGTQCRRQKGRESRKRRPSGRC